MSNFLKSISWDSPFKWAVSLQSPPYFIGPTTGAAAAQSTATKAGATERLPSPNSTAAVTMAEADPSYHKRGEGRYGYIAAGGYLACPATWTFLKVFSKFLFLFDDFLACKKTPKNWPIPLQYNARLDLYKKLGNLWKDRTNLRMNRWKTR